MRYLDPQPLAVSIEGLDLGTGIMINTGALTLEDDQVPVTWGQVDGRQIGIATNMRRQGYNVFMDIRLNEDIVLDLNDGIVGSVFASPFRAHPEKNPLTGIEYQVIDSGRIRAVQLNDKV